MKQHRFFGIFMLGKPVLVINDPELVKTVLVKDFNTFCDRTLHVKEDQQPVTTHMMFFSKNPEWKIMRNLVTPAFTSGKLRAMVPLINEVGENMKMYIDKHACEGKCLEAKEVCAKYSTDVISSCAFGINAHCFENENAQFRKIGKSIFDFELSNAVQQTCTFFAPGVANFLRMKMFNPKSMDFLSDTFLRTVEKREKSEQKRNDLIDIIIDIKKKAALRGNYNIGMYPYALLVYSSFFQYTSYT